MSTGWASQDEEQPLLGPRVRLQEGDRFSVGAASSACAVDVPVEGVRDLADFKAINKNASLDLIEKRRRVDAFRDQLDPTTLATRRCEMEK